MSAKKSFSNPDRLVAMLKERATKLGFDAFGIVGANARPDLEQKLNNALKNNWHAGMDWMEQTKARRSSAKTLWPEARSIIILAMNYAPLSNPMADLAQKSRGNISVYARNKDYHSLIKGRLKELAGLLAKNGEAEVKVFVDTAPVMEKPLAQSAGIGWQGKNSVLTSRSFGSWLFLGSIFTNIDLPVDQPHQEICGSCTACLDICPTNAFVAPFRLDARKCLAYYNNEHQGPIPKQFRKAMGNRIFGCDDCLAVCPWNKFAKTTKETKLQAREDMSMPPLADLLGLDDEEFRKIFAGSPVKRLGHKRFLRNVLIAVGNCGDKNLLPPARKLLPFEDPIVRGAAIWAIKQLASRDDFMQLCQQYIGGEKHPQVLTEWEI